MDDEGYMRREVGVDSGEVGGRGCILSEERRRSVVEMDSGGRE